MLNFRITAIDHCRRVDSFLRGLLPLAPASYLSRLVKTGHLLVDGRTVEGSTLLRVGNHLTLKETSRTRELFVPARPWFDILFEDHWIIAINKPPGMPVHRAAEVDEWNLVEQGERFLSGPDSPVKLRPVNRLDRGTSGVIILARSATAAGMFGRTVMEGGLGKVYLAVVNGRPRRNGTVTVPVDGKEATTVYRLLYQGDGEALLALFPLTGRLHQIRMHLRHIGHPVLGDRRYGGKELTDYPGHLLHSFRTDLIHPATESAIAIIAPLPKEFLTRLTVLGGNGFDGLLSTLSNLRPASLIHSGKSP